MDTNEQEFVAQNDTEETVNDTEEILLDVEEDEQPDVDALRKQIETLQAQKDHWKNKANKPADKVQEKSNDLSSKDLYALMEAKVSQDDVDDVVDFAKFKGITVQEALKAPTVKTLLQVKAEERNTAIATHSGSSKRTTQKISDDVLLENAKKGQMPDSEQEIIRLIRARKGLKN